MKKHTIRILILAAAGILPASLQAQVPAVINYQGRVADSSGVGLGTGTPVNRKVLFRLFDASTAGTRLWTEEQTVTIANGEFSVLLGTGVTATGTASGESRPALDGVFTSGTSARFLELTVDNGDNAFTAADQPISPRQRITSTAYTFRAQSAESIAVGSSLQMGTNADSGLGFYGTGRLFGGQNINGPVLYGSSGGALGSVSGATQNLALRWDASNNVTTTGDLTINGKAIARNSLLLGPPANGVMGGDGMRFLLYPGSATSMPYGFGIENGAIYSLVSETIQAHRWYANSTRVMSVNEGGNGLLNVPAGFTTAGSLAAASVSSTNTISAGGVITGGGFTTAGAINAGGAINSSGTIGAANFSTGGTIGAVGNINGGSITTAGALSAGSITSAGNITLSALRNLGIGTATPMATSPVAYPADWNGFHVVSNNATGILQGATHSRLHFRSTGSLTGNQDFMINVGSNSVNMSWLNANLSERLSCLAINGDGNIGIGTTTANRAKLVIANSPQRSRAQDAWADYAYFFGPGNSPSLRGVETETGTTAVSIYADGELQGSRIRAFATTAYSDERIKLVQGQSDGSKDLELLQAIQITDYLYKDVVALGNVKQKKVIAQQVEKVFPQAISMTKDVVPDIYRKAASKGGWVELKTDLKKGERVRLITEKESGIHEVLEVAPGRFRTSFTPKSDQVFVFGREVQDFRSVDYDAISMLNVSATQQIKKEKDAEVAALKAENEKLRLQLKDQAARLVALEAAEDVRDAKLAAKLAAIEKLLGGAEKPAARTVSLKKDSGAE